MAALCNAIIPSFLLTNICRTFVDKFLCLGIGFSNYILSFSKRLSKGMVFEIALTILSPSLSKGEGATFA
jgi:hypothetical protein